MTPQPSSISVGTSGWSYRDWHGVVYPTRDPTRRGERLDELAYLAEFFDAVEVNSSFYRPPRADYARSWLQRTAFKPDFTFTFKLWQRFTHQRDERWTPAEADLYRQGIAPIAEADRLGALLVQFPWSFRFTEPNLDWLTGVAGAFREFPLVVEVRHATWIGDEALAALRQMGVSFCNIDQPVTRQAVPPGTFVTGPIGYVRLHGRNRAAWFDPQAGRDQRYDYLYTDDELADWINRIGELTQKTDRVYVFTNNHYRGQAPANALQIMAELRGGPVRVPEPLARTYPVLERIALHAGDDPSPTPPPLDKGPSQRRLF